MVMEFHSEELKKEIPAELAEWKQIPGLGPKKIALIWKSLDITTMDQLRAAAENGKIAALPGMGEKSASMILQGMDSLSRRSDRLPLWKAAPIVASRSCQADEATKQPPTKAASTAATGMESVYQRAHHQRSAAGASSRRSMFIAWSSCLVFIRVPL